VSEPARKVLIIDDNEDLRYLMQSLLREAGYDVVTAENGEQALQAAGRFSFDLFILDLRLPDIGGFELIERLREELPGAAIVVVSGYAGCLEQRRLGEMGVARVLGKPFRANRLLESVHALTGRPGALTRLWESSPEPAL
jgi:CheY-like chemotaxis protein